MQGNEAINTLLKLGEQLDVKWQSGRRPPRPSGWLGDKQLILFPVVSDVVFIGWQKELGLIDLAPASEIGPNSITADAPLCCRINL